MKWYLGFWLAALGLAGCDSQPAARGPFTPSASQTELGPIEGVRLLQAPTNGDLLEFVREQTSLERSRRRRVAVIVGAERCADCSALVRVLTSADTAPLYRDLTVIAVDVTRHRAELTRAGVFTRALPMLARPREEDGRLGGSLQGIAGLSSRELHTRIREVLAPRT